MVSKLTRHATAHPVRVILAWLVAGVLLALVGSVAAYRVTTDDTAQFLPSRSLSAQATRYGQEAFGAQKGTTTVTLLAQRADGRPLRAADQAAIDRLTAGLTRWRPARRPLVDAADGIDLGIAARAGRIVGVSAGPRAPDGRFALTALQWKANTTDAVAQQAFRQLRDGLGHDAARAGLRVGFTGGLASASDLAKATSGRQTAAQILLLGAVLLLSLAFFRGVLAAVLPLLAVGIVGGAATGLIVLVALVSGLRLDQSTPQLISTVLIGIGIDYFMFLLFRVRENLRAGDDRRAAAAGAGRRVGPVIAAAALTVVVAFATLGLARFGQLRTLGPCIAVAVLVMAAAGMTLMPAIAAVGGRKLFWPSKGWQRDRRDGFPARLGAAIAARPSRAALGVTAALVVLAAGALGTRMSYDLGDGGPSTPATRTADEISAALPKGAADLQPVYVRSDDGNAPLTARALASLQARLAATPGVGSVSAPAFTSDRRGARLDVALKADATSAASMAVARGPLRRAAHDAAPAGSTVLVAGSAAVYADVSDAIDHDLRLIFPVAAALILLVLVVTLRSAATSLFLLAAVALEFAATLGATVLAFQTVGGHDGVAFTLPLVLFLFVVALGTDYNILMTLRLKEELASGAPVRDAVATAVRRAAPAIAAAGLVLATSFATLMLQGDSTSAELGFAMALGILVASLLVSSILVPAAVTMTAARRERPRRVTIRQTGQARS